MAVDFSNTMASLNQMKEKFGDCVREMDEHIHDLETKANSPPLEPAAASAVLRLRQRLTCPPTTENWSISLDDARRKIEAYRTDYTKSDQWLAG